MLEAACGFFSTRLKTGTLRRIHLPTIFSFPDADVTGELEFGSSTYFKILTEYKFNKTEVLLLHNDIAMAYE